jgi:hypothetical protein
VTGGAGFIGSTLTDRLLAEGCEVDVVDDLSTGSLGNLADARGRRTGRCKFHRLDIRNPGLTDLIVHRRPEVVFHLATGRAARNVETGMPLVLSVAPGFAADEHAFFGPGETEFAPTPAGDEFRPAIRLDDTRLPGVYRLARREEGDAANSPEYFVVDFDRAESDLTPLDDAARMLLTRNDRMAFVSDRDELKRQMFTDSSRTELWYVLLLVFLAILIGEVLMTRRLVRGGHAAVEEPVDEPRAEAY